jgi:hypothetical protein
MAKQISQGPRVKIKVRRKGIHSKNNCSNLKSSKLYRKTYKGQGR